jgi:hypothetical protein
MTVKEAQFTSLACRRHMGWFRSTDMVGNLPGFEFLDYTLTAGE